MADTAAAESSGGHEPVVELRKEAYTLALYVAICLLAAFAALPETGAHAHVIGLIWGVTVGLALAHWFAFGVSARWWAPGVFALTMWSRPVPSWRGGGSSRCRR
jgi:hypothetical protein